MEEGASCFCAALLTARQLAVTEGKINLTLCQDILQDNFTVAVSYLKLNRSWMMQEDSDHQTNSTTERF